MTIANVFVDSQDEIRLILLLMYKTIIIIIIIVVRRPIIIGLSNCHAILPQCCTSHTHTQMRIKAKVYFGRPRLHTVIKRARGQSRTPSECRQFFETRASQVGGPAHV